MGISCRQFRFRRECLVIRLSAAEIATAPLGPRNDKSGSIAPLNSCHQYCQPAWRSLSAATDAIGAYHFIGSHYESAASRRARLSAPLQHYIALQKGRTARPALQLVKKVPLGFFAKLMPFRIAKSIFAA